MDASSIYQQIRIYESRIRDYEEENRSLRKKNEGLDEAARQYKGKQQALSNYKNGEKAAAHRLKELSQVRIAGSYAEALHTLTTNHQSTQAEDAFTSILGKLEKGKQRNNDKITDNNNAIGNLRREIAYLRSRLAALD